MLAAFSRSNQEIQTYAIALINALFLKAPEDRRQVRVQLRSTEYTRAAAQSCFSFTTATSSPRGTLSKAAPNIIDIILIRILSCVRCSVNICSQICCKCLQQASRKSRELIWPIAFCLPAVTFHSLPCVSAKTKTTQTKGASALLAATITVPASQLCVNCQHLSKLTQTHPALANLSVQATVICVSSNC